jgi:hypothetical protein
MVRLAFAIALVAVCVALPAAATPAFIRAASWADNQHGWVECRESEVCATEDGGRTWHDIFTGGNFIFSLVRTSAGAGVTQTGRTIGSTFWTRNNGKRWYELPNVPVPDLGSGGNTRALVLEGRGGLLFWHQSEQTLNQITPWPATVDPPCNGPSWPGPNTCVLAAADSPFTSTAVATIPTGSLDRMRNIDGGVAALVTADDPNASPAAVLVHRGDSNAVTTLPEPPLSRRSLMCTEFFAGWPALFVSAASYTGKQGCSKLARVLWRSADSGRTWTVAATKQVAQVSAGTPPGALGKVVLVPGGAVVPMKTTPARLELRQLAKKRDVLLPAGSRCRVAQVIAAWPALYVTGRRADGTTPIRWWSDDGGATWAVFGRC